MVFLRFVFTVFLFVSSFGCSKKEGYEKEKRPLRICFGDEVRTLDPRFGGELPTCHVICMLFDGLMRRDENGDVVPSVAESYEVFEDKTVYIFHLKKTFWSDGHAVTAHDFEYAWKKSLDPKTLSHGAQNFYFIKNAKSAVMGEVSPDEVGVHAIDDQTLRVELEYPVPYFIETLGCTLLSPIPKHVDQVDPMWAHRADETFVSNGPFRLKEWKKGNQIIVEKNPSYWDRDHVYLSEIQMGFIDDGMTQLYLFEKKEIDWIGIPISPVPPEAMESLKKTASYTTVESPAVYWFFINTDKHPFNNSKIRKAFAYALDRQSIVDAVLDGNGKPACGIVAPCFGLHNPHHFKDRSVTQAQALFAEGLEELGLTLETFPPVELKYAAGIEILSRIVLLAQRNWEEAFGVSVELGQADWPVHYTSVQKGDYQLGLMRWYSFINDPIYMLQTFQFKGDMVNMSNWESKEYQDLLDKSNYQSNPRERNATLIKAEKVLMEEMPIIPICFLNMEFSKQDELVGVNLPSSGEIDFKFATFQ